MKKLIVQAAELPKSQSLRISCLSFERTAHWYLTDEKHNISALASLNCFSLNKRYKYYSIS